MKIGIFSDIHDHCERLPQVLEIFKSHNIENAFFCGDLVSPFTLYFIKDWPIKVKAVFGNNEGDKWGIARRLKKYDIKNWEYAPKSGLFWDAEMEYLKIACFHGHSKELTEALVTSKKYDLVLTGHTHIPLIKAVNDTTWINPGSVVGIAEDPNIKNGSVAIFNTIDRQGEIINL